MHKKLQTTQINDAVHRYKRNPEHLLNLWLRTLEKRASAPKFTSGVGVAHWMLRKSSILRSLSHRQMWTATSVAAYILTWPIGYIQHMRASGSNDTPLFYFHFALQCLNTHWRQAEDVGPQTQQVSVSKRNYRLCLRPWSAQRIKTRHINHTLKMWVLLNLSMSTFPVIFAKIKLRPRTEWRWKLPTPFILFSWF